MRYGEWDARRTVYMDGRKRPANEPLKPLGYSVGHWEGDVLVIDSGLRAGLELLTQFGSAGAGTGEPPPLVERIRDEHSGQSYLKIRMPPPEVMDRVAGALQALLESLRA